MNHMEIYTIAFTKKQPGFFYASLEISARENRLMKIKGFEDLLNHSQLIIFAISVMAMLVKNAGAGGAHRGAGAGKNRPGGRSLRAEKNRRRERNAGGKLGRLVIEGKLPAESPRSGAADIAVSIAAGAVAGIAAANGRRVRAVMIGIMDMPMVMDIAGSAFRMKMSMLSRMLMKMGVMDGGRRKRRQGRQRRVMPVSPLAHSG